MYKGKINLKTMGMRTAAITLAAALVLPGCGTAASSDEVSADKQTGVQTEAAETAAESSAEEERQDASELFTERDLAQTADLTEASVCTVTDGEDIHITEEGVYVLQGTAADVTVYVEADDADKVQLVLDGVSVTNADTPCIYVVSADKVFVTTAADSTLTVSGSFAADEENADAAVFSCEDLVLNGTAALQISSSDAGVDTKDDLKITGGSYDITAGTKALEANDSIHIADGSFVLQAGTDGLHAENNDDDTVGDIVIEGGTFSIQAGDDGIHGTTVIQIDGGDFTIRAAEGIEATCIQISGGSFEISASDDGINAGRKSSAFDVLIEITGGEFNITMDAGDTDAIDSNGDLIISGGTLNISAQSAFDYDGTGTYTGGTLTVNGEMVTELTQSMMGPGGGNVPGGERPEMGERPENGTMPDSDKMPGMSELNRNGTRQNTEQKDGV